MSPSHVAAREVEVLLELVRSGCGEAVAALGKLLRRPASAGAPQPCLVQPGDLAASPRAPRAGDGGRRSIPRGAPVAAPREAPAAGEILARLEEGGRGGRRAGELVAVAVRLEGPLAGQLLLALPARDAEHLAAALGYPVSPGGSFGQLAESAVMESGNIVGSAFVSAVAHRVGGRLLTGVPVLARGHADACLARLLGTRAPALGLATRVAVGGPELLEGLILVVPDPAALPTLLAALDSP